MRKGARKHDVRPLPVYVISLLPRADRRAWIVEHLRRVGLSFTFFDATDARNLDRDPLARLYDPACFAAQNPGCPGLSAALVACALSHYRHWQHVAASGAPWTLVLEDDAVLTMENPAPSLEAAAATAGPQDVVLLNSRCCGVWRQDRVALWPGPHTLYRVNSETELAGAYLLSTGAAQCLAAAVTRDGVLRAADWWHRRHGGDWSRIVPIRMVKPDRVAQHVELGSDIVTAHNDGYLDFVHDDTHRALTLFFGLVRDPRNPRYWPLLVSRGLQRVYGYHCVPPRCRD